MCVCVHVKKPCLMAFKFFCLNLTNLWCFKFKVFRNKLSCVSLGCANVFRDVQGIRFQKPRRRINSINSSPPIVCYFSADHTARINIWLAFRRSGKYLLTLFVNLSVPLCVLALAAGGGVGNRRRTILISTDGSQGSSQVCISQGSRAIISHLGSKHACICYQFSMTVIWSFKAACLLWCLRSTN